MTRKIYLVLEEDGEIADAQDIEPKDEPLSILTYRVIIEVLKQSGLTVSPGSYSTDEK